MVTRAKRQKGRQKQVDKSTISYFQLQVYLLCNLPCRWQMIVIVIEMIVIVIIVVIGEGGHN